MKGKITNEGRLYILRGDRYKAQHCPHSFNRCGDWCPLFGEPVERPLIYTTLDLCRKKLSFDGFKDERTHTREESL